MLSSFGLWTQAAQCFFDLLLHGVSVCTHLPSLTFAKPAWSPQEAAQLLGLAFSQCSATSVNGAFKKKALEFHPETWSSGARDPRWSRTTSPPCSHATDLRSYRSTGRYPGATHSHMKQTMAFAPMTVESVERMIGL